MRKLLILSAVLLVMLVVTGCIPREGAAPPADKPDTAQEDKLKVWEKCPEDVSEVEFEAMTPEDHFKAEKTYHEKCPKSHEEDKGSGAGGSDGPTEGYAYAGNDFSRLTYYGAQPIDSVLVICDRSSNGYQAVGRGGNDGTSGYQVRAEGGAGTCSDRFLGFNAGWHDAAISRNHSFGGNSNHGS